MTRTRYRYWDSATFLAWLSKEAKRCDLCTPVIEAAEQGQLRIVTSAMTLTEVIYVRDSTGALKKLPPGESGQINRFFRHEWIVLREVDRTIGEAARDLIWNHGVRPRDALHLATALAGDVDYDQFDTFDKDLVLLSGKLGKPPLVIGFPNLPQKLPFGDPEAPVAGETGTPESV